MRPGSAQPAAVSRGEGPGCPGDRHPRWRCGSVAGTSGLVGPWPGHTAGVADGAVRGGPAVRAARSASMTAGCALSASMSTGRPCPTTSRDRRLLIRSGTRQRERFLHESARRTAWPTQLRAALTERSAWWRLMTRPAPWQMEENAAAFDADQHVGERAPSSRRSAPVGQRHAGPLADPDDQAEARGWRHCGARTAVPVSRPPRGGRHVATPGVSTVRRGRRSRPVRPMDPAVPPAAAPRLLPRGDAG
jgi:hypothetical protein